MLLYSCARLENFEADRVRERQQNIKDDEQQQIILKIAEKIKENHTWTDEAGSVTDEELLDSKRGRKIASAGLNACLPPDTAL